MQELKKPKLHIIALVLLIAFVFMEGLFFIRIFPKYQIPDEERYVRNVLIMDKGEIPYFTTESKSGHPILYEALTYPLYKAFNFNLYYRFSRVLSLIFFITTIILAYRITEMLFPDSITAQFFTVSFLAFSPQLTFILSSINSDSLLLFLFTAVLFLLIKGEVKGFKLVDYVLLLLAIIAGFLTKERFLIILPILAFFIVDQIKRYFDKKANSSKAGKVVVYGSTLLIFIYFVNSILLNYLHQEIDLASYVTKFSIFGLFRIYKQFWWGYFGLLQYSWPIWLYLIFVLVGVFAFVGLVFFFKDKSKLVITKKWFILFLIIALIMLSFVVFYEIKTMSGQGRHLFTVIIPIYLLTSAGLVEFSERLHIEKIALPSFLSFMLLVNIYTVFWKTGWLIS